MRLRSHLLQHRDINLRNNMRRLRNCTTVMRMLKLGEIYQHNVNNIPRCHVQLRQHRYRRSTERIECNAEILHTESANYVFNSDDKHCRGVYYRFEPDKLYATMRTVGGIRSCDGRRKLMALLFVYTFITRAALTSVCIMAQNYSKCPQAANLYAPCVCSKDGIPAAVTDSISKYVR